MVSNPSVEQFIAGAEVGQKENFASATARYSHLYHHCNPTKEMRK